MKRKSKSRAPARFEPETTFEPKTGAGGSARKDQEEKLDALKGRLLEESLTEAWEPEVRRFLASSASEAASLAWLTEYPLLVFPALFEEKAAVALRQIDRQYEIRQRSRELLAV